jgi:hypothetical protein
MIALFTAKFRQPAHQLLSIIRTGVSCHVLHPVLPDEHVVRSHRFERVVFEGAGTRGYRGCHQQFVQRVEEPVRERVRSSRSQQACD